MPEQKKEKERKNIKQKKKEKLFPQQLEMVKAKKNKYRSCNCCGKKKNLNFCKGREKMVENKESLN